MLKSYFKSLYRRAMRLAYDTAYARVAETVDADSAILDCGANNGWTFDEIARRCALTPDQYSGVEWSPQAAEAGRARKLNIVTGDLNKHLAYETGRFSCVYALSVLEHLLNPCRFLQECHRVLRPGGRLVLLTPNISTYFTALLILSGRMPSSGPHPDSEALLKKEELFKVSIDGLKPDPESDLPVHRHLVVFSFRVLRDYLGMIGFRDVRGWGFGLYPFPNFAQPALERLDPYHCHQMVFSAVR